MWNRTQPMAWAILLVAVQGFSQGKIVLKLESAVFQEGNVIPKKYTCDSLDINPPLAWNVVPEGTASLALICDDPDAPAGTWVHWVVFNLPPDARSLPEAVSPEKELHGGIRQGSNDFRRIGYGGPCPPSGTHRYFFRLYALDIVLGLAAGSTKAQVEAAMKGHVVGEASLMGIYSR